MDKNTLTWGIIILSVGLIVLFAGTFGYYDLRARDPYNYNGLMMWSLTMTIGIILFIVGIISSIVGFFITSSKTVDQQIQKRFCPSCGRDIPINAMVCPYCGKNFSLK
jgi:uncharacterized membrane protein HdeD (DUF308 family)